METPPPSFLTCQKCGQLAESKTPWRCKDHNGCDRCGTRADVLIGRDDYLCRPCYEEQIEERVREFSGDTEFTQEPICCHCGEVQSDGWELSEGEQQCDYCGRLFYLTRDVEVTYTTQPIKGDDVP